MSLISYIKQLWDTTSFVNPTRLNHMEDGIKSACDGVDAISKDATETEAGLMSASDKAKLDGIESGATASSGTITGITMNGASKGTSGVVNLGTVVTDVSGKQDTVDNSLGTSAKTIVGAINEVNTGLAGKSDTSHNHDSRYYTESEIDTKLSNIGSTHNHDDRYYTESEIDTKFNRFVYKKGDNTVDEIKAIGYDLYTDGINKNVYLYGTVAGSFNLAIYGSSKTTYWSFDTDGIIKVAGSKKYYTTGDIDTKISDLTKTSLSSKQTVSASTSLTKYTVPSDGYIICYVTSTSGTCGVAPDSSSGTYLIKIPTGNPAYTFNSLYVRKGMNVYVTKSSSGAGIVFEALQ